MVGFGLTGAWRRSGLLVDGQRVVDRCEVLWLQTQDWYADIRIPVPGPGPGLEPPPAPERPPGPAAVLSREWAFAGIAEWDPPVMTWEHLFDSNLDPAVDANPLEKVGGLLIETGTITVDGRRVPFVEEWSKVSSPGDAIRAETIPDGVRVTVGDRRISVCDRRPAGEFLAVREERSPSGWGEWGRVCVPPARARPPRSRR